MPSPCLCGRTELSAGVLVLAEIERRLGIDEMIRFRALLIAAGCPDANDCDALRFDPALKMAVGRLPRVCGV